MHSLLHYTSTCTDQHVCKAVLSVVLPCQVLRTVSSTHHFTCMMMQDWNGVNLQLMSALPAITFVATYLKFLFFVPYWAIL